MSNQKIKVNENQPPSGESSGLLKTSELVASPTFTPAPWRITGDAGHPTNLRITSTRRRHVAKVYAYTTSRDEIAEANARLIAAAPALYEALVAVVAIADRKTVEFDKARAALALATTQAASEQKG